jgi:hypothetical protein
LFLPVNQPVRNVRTVPSYSVPGGSLVGNEGFTGALTRVPGETASAHAIQKGVLTAGGNYEPSAGRTIPIKLQLLDAAANSISSSDIDLTAIRLERLNADGTRTQVALQDSGKANPGNLFRYDAGLDGHIFNLSTKGVGADTYDFFWSADGDPLEHTLRFKLI